jgi:hypothetical protein
MVPTPCSRGRQRGGQRFHSADLFASIDAAALTPKVATVSPPAVYEMARPRARRSGALAASNLSGTAGPFSPKNQSCSRDLEAAAGGKLEEAAIAAITDEMPADCPISTSSPGALPPIPPPFPISLSNWRHCICMTNSGPCGWEMPHEGGRPNRYRACRISTSPSRHPGNLGRSVIAAVGGENAARAVLVIGRLEGDRRPLLSRTIKLSPIPISSHGCFGRRPRFGSLTGCFR